MSDARAALMDACLAIRAYRYLPDTVTTLDGMVVPVDIWDTLAEFEARQGGDCDGHACWTIERAALRAPGPFYFVAGEVLVRGTWNGHAWVELDEPDERLWADPTWGHGPQSPRALGYPATRRPWKRWRYAGEGLFDREEDYVMGGAA